MLSRVGKSFAKFLFIFVLAIIIILPNSLFAKEVKTWDFDGSAGVGFYQVNNSAYINITYGGTGYIHLIQGKFLSAFTGRATSPAVTDIVADSQYLYLTKGTGGFEIKDKSNFSTVGSIAQSSFGANTNLEAVFVSGNYAYIASSGGAKGFYIVDVSNKSNPTIASSLDITSGANDNITELTVIGNYAYLADKDHGLRVIDVSNVNSPTLAASLDTVTNV